MNYQDALERLYRLTPRGIRLGLSDVQDALRELGHPERDIPFVHVAGTNGKGSTSAMIATGLKQAGYRTGLFTSPHLNKLTERIQLDGEPIPESELAARVSTWFSEPGVHRELSFFETMTVIALEAFRDAHCDFVVLEVGLGGRLDATNVVTPRLSVITRIDFDHMDRLGETIEDIAQEKAGIIKPNVPVLAAPGHIEAARVIDEVAQKVHAPCYLLGRDFHIATSDLSALDMQCVDGRMLHINPPWIAPYQRNNVALAAQALSILGVNGATIEAGIHATVWPGRFERLESTPPIILDGAHNPDGCKHFIEALESSSVKKARPRTLLFSAMKDKDIRAMLSVLTPHVDHLIATGLGTHRSMSQSDFLSATKELSDVQWRDNIDDAIEQARLLSRDGIILVVGSLVLVGEVRARCLGLATEPPISL